MKVFLLAQVLTVFGFLVGAHGEVRVVIDHNDNEHATPNFAFQKVPSPARNDAASRALFTILSGQQDRNGGDLDKLHDGALPAEEDQPKENFFFNVGSEGGRIEIDLHSVIEIQQVNTYAWHPAARGPQVYTLFASDGQAAGFEAQPKTNAALDQCGWVRLTKVDTRPKGRQGGGQYGVSISGSAGSLGNFRYLLFDIVRTEDEDLFGNTFYSEIDVIQREAPIEPIVTASTRATETIETRGGYQITLDTSETPDLTDWAHQSLAPVVQEWYPKIVELLPSNGFEAPKRVDIKFRKDMQGVAATGGSRIRCAAKWFRENRQGEAVGSVVHELVHVVQQYGRARTANPDATRPPGWLVEGIADYIRWFLYEPQSHGAEITQRNLARARYDANYRISANFLNWVTAKYAPGLVKDLNAAIRDGKYSEALWRQHTGHALPELGDEWKAELQKRIGAGTSGQ